MVIDHADRRIMFDLVSVCYKTSAKKKYIFIVVFAIF